MAQQQEYAVVVAGGSGTRMKSEIPKQFLPIGGQPLLMHTLEAFYRYSPEVIIILVLPEADMDRWKQLCTEHNFTIPHTRQTGGKSRYQSVRRGLDKIHGDGLVAVHDGVRPFILPDSLGASYRLAAIHGSAVASVRLKDSIRITDKDTTKAVDRSQFRLIQTPQTFQVKLIKEAYEAVSEEGITDDASVAEKAGHRISLFEGSYENIKITTPEDLYIGEAIFSKQIAERE
ncbi:MAG TPA: 2-C-methyl-D-erythritol 4-phosphate cytidylyltransferase [Cytophagales bacterium]|nr:2-C-methyl-D-erythritol 4-phosphate cytidylyltransferase [Cytophagales bacterium]HAA19886.1 2-C-methyl-D-erythritol 4-phosphate cytidylyltransferase [Cytophagales bacterium]HAP62687.1 2-C-methyl-D-erythritol 4-phosphate cytidylyltransferase [Cytophagales bacterium]